MRRLSLITPLSILAIASLLLQWCPSTAQAINVELPDEFLQCEPAQINLTQSRGNVTIVIRRPGTRLVDTNVTLPVNATSWTWPAVDFPAGSNFTILVTDVSPRKKTSDTRVLSRSTVDPSPTNNDTCLPRQSGKKGSGSKDGHGAAGMDPGESDGFFGPHAGERRKDNTVEVAVIAGVLGGLMFVLLALTLFMCFRRRFEMRGAHHDDAADDAQRYPMAARRLRDDVGVYDSHQVVTLFGHDGQPEGQAVLGRQGDAGWTYMSRMVPGLESSSPVAVRRHSNAARRRSAAGRRRVTTRYDDEQKDAELPSYGLSEYERKNLPKYNDDDVHGDHDGATVAAAAASRDADNEQDASHSVLHARRDSRGSRLPFSSPAHGAFRVQSHIVSTPRASVALYHGQRLGSQTARPRMSGVLDERADDEDGVIVFGAAAPSSHDGDGDADLGDGHGSDATGEEELAPEDDHHRRTLL